MISTIILNWNRVALLKQTVESYLRTVRGDFERFIADNASSDDSHDYLRQLESQGAATVLFLPERRRIQSGYPFNSWRFAAFQR
jgi:GT2 family glycosyltransferase